MMIVGIDVSKDKLDIALPADNPAGKQKFQIKNTYKAIAQLFNQQLKQVDASLIVFEATGGYERTLHLYLIKQSMSYHRADPTRVHYFAKSKGIFAKTDSIDANTLRLYGEQADIVPDESTTAQQLELQTISSRKHQLKEMISSEKHRLNTLSEQDKLVRKSVKRIIKCLENELDIIHQKIMKLIRSSEELSRKFDLLKTAKGVGDELASTFVADCPELGNIKREQVSTLVGVAPRNNDSGKKNGYRSITRGRFHLRRILYMGALVASKHDPRMSKIYQKLLAKGKAKKVALVAIMRKMVVMLNAMVKNSTPWHCEEF